MATAKAFSPAVLPAIDTAMGSEVYRGLTSTPKTLSPWLFYDEPGSVLFEQITELPSYYLTRTERGIFREHAAEIVASAAAGRRLAIIELGAGTASKTGLLLEAAAAQQGSVEYYPIDVSESALDEACNHLEQELRDVHIHPRVGDYTDGLGSIDVEPDTRRLVLYIGSSIGNFEPGNARTLLADVRAQLAPGDQILIGADQAKDSTRLLAAYDDPEGVTAQFNCNVLTRINRELGGDFHLLSFSHEARWNPTESRIEMHLRSDRRQRVAIRELGLELQFEHGETIHTENSYKFTDASIGSLLQSGGFAERRRWKDDQGWFGVYLAEAI